MEAHQGGCDCWGQRTASCSAAETSLLPLGSFWGLTGGVRDPPCIVMTDPSRFTLNFSLYTMLSFPDDPFQECERVRPSQKRHHFLRRQWNFYLYPSDPFPQPREM